MEAFMDKLWMQIAAGVAGLCQFADKLLAPLHFWGPLPVILLLCLFTVGLTKFLSRNIKTKRYLRLKKEFQHWQQVRQEAMQCEDKEKGRLLAKNIDQGKLNRVYYDYFFEGLMLGLATRYLPILIVAAYINETYRPAALLERFGREYLFKMGTTDNGEPFFMGAVFFYVLALIATYVVWGLVAKYGRRRNQGPSVRVTQLA